MTRLRADFLLLITAIIWGVSFVFQKKANDSLGPIVFIGARFFLSWLVLMPFAFWEHKKSRTDLTFGDFAISAVMGLCLFVGAGLQQIGLETTTVSNGGILTTLYVVFVPFVVWGLSRQKPRPIVLFASVIAITGAWLVAGKGNILPSTSGDLLVIIADIAWAIGISLVPIFLNRTHRPFYLAFIQYGLAGFLGLLIGGWYEPITLDGLSLAVPSILYTGLLSGGIGFTLQIFAQKHTPAAEAALIMSLESIFAALAGAFILSERLTTPAIFGGILILLGICLVEAGPLLGLSIRKSISKRTV